MDGRIFRAAFGKAVGTAPLLCALVLAACNGGGGDGGSGSSGGSGGSASAPTYIVRGTISGLAGSGLRLQNNGGDNLVVAGAGNSFQFSGLADHAAYNVSVLAHPSAPSQTCSVTNGTGTISGGAVTNVQISCATNSYLVGGTVTGLTGSGLALRLNGGIPLPIISSPNFTFPTPVESGARYVVEVLTPPSSPAQTCTVSGGSGSLNDGSGIMGTANVTNIIVACVANTSSSTPRTVRADVSGLTSTSLGLTLQLNGGTPYSVPGNGLHVLSNSLTDGTPYTVAVSTPPSSPAQTCTLANASGVISGDVTVAVTCADQVFTIGGSLTGLSGSGLQLQLNGGEILSVARGSTSFTFTAVANTSDYRVAVRAQPVSPSQNCTLTNETGAVSGANVTTVQGNCVTNSFPVSVTVNGLSGAGLVLQNNGGPGLSISGNGSFAFANAVLSGASYQVTVATPPSSPSQACTLTNGTGTVGNGSVTNVVVDCATNAYAVGGSVSGLSGTGLVLQLNGSTSLSVSGNGNFAFNAIADSSAYAVTVATHPTGLRQTCTVTNGTGTVAGAAVTNVAVSCSLVKWSGIKQFGSAADDVVNAVTLDPTNGDVVVVGCYQGALTGNEKNNCDMPGGNARAYVRKYDRTGDFKWERSLGNASNNQANAVIVDTSGNIYVTGSSQGTFDGQPGFNSDDIFLTKYDTNGNKLWTGVYGTPGPDRGNALAFDATGNLYLGGTVYTTSYDIYVAKFSAASAASLTTAPAAPASPSTAQFSSTQVGTTQPNESAFQLVVNSGGVYVSGTTAGSLNGNVNGGGATGTADTFVMKLDPATLAEVWTRQIGTASYDRNGGVAVDAAGDAYVAGSTGGGLALPPGVPTGMNDLFVVKYDTNGTELWRKQLVSPGHDHVTDIAVVPGGGVYITGYTTGNFDGSSNRDSSTNTTDVFLVKYDGAGTKVWSRIVGTTTDDRAYAVAPDRDPLDPNIDAGAFVAGYTLGALDGNTNVGGADMFIIKYDANGVRQ